jgi:hypothetical protein
VLEGGDGLDRLFGGEDDDTLSGGAGSDYLDGGQGTDVAKMGGKSSDYTVAKGTTTNALGATQDLYYLTDNRAGSPDGVEQLTNIETLSFSDGNLSLADFYSGVRNDDGVAPTLSASTPTAGDSNFGIKDNLTLTFSEAVKVGTGSILISKANGVAVETIAVTDARVTVQDKTVTINPTGDLLANTAYKLSVPAGAILDNAGNAFAGLDGTGALSFTTASATTLGPAPAVTLSSAAPDKVSGGFDVVFTWSDSVSGFAADDLVVTNGTVSTLVAVAGQTNKFSITITTVASNSNLFIH